MPYVDGFVIPIPKANLKPYLAMAKKGGKLWMEHGAVQYFECVGDDLNPPFGVGFPKMAKAGAGETVLFCFIVFKSRAHRDKVNAAVMKDERMHQPLKSMPFKVDRMAYGGFKTIVVK